MKILAAKAALAVSLVLGVGVFQTAQAGIPVIVDGSPTMQINTINTVLSTIESVAQTLKQAEEYATQVQQYQAQLQQYENQLQNTAAPAAYIWDQASRTINKLIEAQDMLAYYQRQAGSLDAYLAKYQDAAYYRGSPCFNGGGCTAAEREAMAANRHLASATQKQANDALFKAIVQQQDNMAADARQLERLQSAASTADGQVKAIQYANQLASHQSNQLLQIRGLMLAQQNALTVRSQADADQAAKELAAHEASTAARGPESLPVNPKKW